ncbi:MAG: SPOR domain-containing protein [Pseudomonadales bacterium]|jgi:cell division protein FtsN|nr:SPOR domain-containing protein [Pseudomonadales bacterium]MBP9033137.1 SPOR domain-containing protein [Pseudomonadales bacterium]
MAHDFAKQRAARANRSGKPEHAPWLWLVSGIVIGTLVSFLVYLATLTPPPQQQPSGAGVTAVEQQPQARAEPQKKTPGPDTKPRFDYYDILRETGNGDATARAAPAQEEAATRPAQPVEVPEPQQTAPTVATAAPAPAPAPGAAPATAAAPTAPAATVAPKPETPKPAGLAMQAGAFSQHADADRRRGEILLLGYDARVETVKTADGQTRYRVTVGPFADPAALANARRALRDVGIDTL